MLSGDGKIFPNLDAFQSQKILFITAYTTAPEAFHPCFHEVPIYVLLIHSFL